MIKRMKESLTFVPPKLLKKLLGRCVWEGTPQSKTLALTFDDGPDQDITPLVLDILDELDSRGTFFLVGDRVRKYPQISRSILDRGHVIGNHSMTHQRMLFMKRREAAYEIDEAQKTISDAVGSAPKWFRPPYGLFNLTTARLTRERELPLVLWTVLSGDYGDNSSDQILAHIEPFIRPGAIQVFHDTVQGGGTKLGNLILHIGQRAAKKGIKIGSIEDLSLAENGEEIELHDS